MCGISFSITLENDHTPTHLQHHHHHDSIWSALVNENARRGPTSQHTHFEEVVIPSGLHLRLQFASAVLALRGKHTAQPLIGSRGVLCWNGQVFQGLPVPISENDTSVLFRRLEGGEEVVTVLAAIEGPYAFVYFEYATQTIYFGRDPFGRRSLLSSLVSSSGFYLSSVRAKDVHTPMEEVPCASLRILRLGDVRSSEDGKLDFSNAIHTVGRVGTSHSPTVGRFTTIPRVCNSISTDSEIPPSIDVVKEFIRVLNESVRLRVENIPIPPTGHARLAILFSGGIDCTFLTHLAHLHLPPDEPIDLINVSFENPRSIAAHHGLMATRRAARMKKIRKMGLEDAVEIQEETMGVYDVPDRLTGREAVDELARLQPEREWRFVEVDVTYEQSQKAKERVLGLMYPNDTEMDLSLALPLFFASRLDGHLRSPGSDTNPSIRTPYKSQAKVLLSGLGADELLGGYARHRKAFEVAGFEGAIDELQMDLDRLPSRNLGRDDRIISSHGVETRFPYLSLSVVDHIASLLIHYKIGLASSSSPGGLADKIILRMACLQTGLVLAASRKKRAMQFGTRSARMEMEDGEDGRGKGGRGIGLRKVV